MLHIKAAIAVVLLLTAGFTFTAALRPRPQPRQAYCMICIVPHKPGCCAHFAFTTQFIRTEQ